MVSMAGKTQSYTSFKKLNLNTVNLSPYGKRERSPIRKTYDTDQLKILFNL